jgi:hypothetical protein
MKNDDDEHHHIQKTEQPHTTTHKKQTQPTKPQTKNICMYVFERARENRLNREIREIEEGR